MKKKIKNRSLSLLLITALAAATVVPQWDGSISDLREVQADAPATMPSIDGNITGYALSSSDHAFFKVGDDVVNKYKLSSYTYALTDDVTIENIETGYRGNVIPSGTTVNILLNGYTLTFAAGKGPAFVVMGGGILNIYNDSESGGIEDLGNTQTQTSEGIAGSFESHRTNSYGGVFRIIGQNSTVNIEDGSFSGSCYQKGGVAYIQEDGNLNMYGGRITGTSGSKSAGGIAVGHNVNDDTKKAHFTMYGGEIIDCQANSGWGAGIQVYGDAHIYGGTISNCTCKDGGGGIDVEPGGKLYLSNCTITGNRVSTQNNGCYKGGGIYVHHTDNTLIDISGNVNIYDNYQGTSGNEQNNVYLHGVGSQYTNITVSGDLDSDHKIGISSPIAHEGLVLTSGFDGHSSGKAPLNCFYSDVSTYKIGKVNDEAALVSPSATHTHQYTYSASENVITATCADNDGLHGENGSPISGTYTLTGSNSFNLGDTLDFAVTGSVPGDTAPSIAYEDSEHNALTGAPSSAGSYFAKITKGTAVVTKAFTINEPTPEPEPTPTPSPTPSGGGSSGSSSSSSSSSDSGSSAPAPTNAKPSSGGETKVTDASGQAITNSIVTVKVADATGKTVSKQVLTDESGNIAKQEVVTVTQQVSANGKTSNVTKTYLACSDGTIYDKPGFAEVESTLGLSAGDLSFSDTVVFVNEDGSLKQSEKFTVTTKSGKKIFYAVGDDCNLIRNGFFNAKKTGTTGKSIKGGASYFAGANGQLITKSLFTVKTTKSGKVKVKINKKGSLFSKTVFINDLKLYRELKAAGLKNAKGEQYYATASGKIAKDKWVNVGLKEYYCGSNGKITKTR